MPYLPRIRPINATQEEGGSGEYMKQSLTHHEIIVKYLATRDGWVPSHTMQKLNTEWGFTGARGDRDARDLATNSVKHLQNRVKRRYGHELIAHGITKDTFDKPVNATYAYYRAIKPQTYRTVRAVDSYGQIFTESIPVW